MVNKQTNKTMKINEKKTINENHKIQIVQW